MDRRSQIVNELWPDGSKAVDCEQMLPVRVLVHGGVEQTAGLQ